MRSRPPIGELADPELMERVARRDEAAFTELMRRHEDLVFRVGLRMVRDRELALEVTQDVFLTLWRKASRWRAEAAVTTWLYRIAVNASIDTLRKMKRRPTTPLPTSYDFPDPRSEDPFQAVASTVDRALGELPAEFRAVVILADLEGLPLQDVADTLGVPLGTVKSRLFRARRLLAPLLGNLEQPPTRRTDDA